jgi:hypothetical protein
MTFKGKLLGSSTNTVLSISIFLVEAIQIISLKLSDSYISTTYDCLHIYFVCLYNVFCLVFTITLIYHYRHLAGTFLRLLRLYCA